MRSSPTSPRRCAPSPPTAEASDDDLHVRRGPAHRQPRPPRGGRRGRRRKDDIRRSPPRTGGCARHRLRPGAARHRHRLRRPAMTTSLSRNRNYTLLWTSQAVSEVGFNATLIAFPLVVLMVTGSAALSGAVLAVDAVAQLVVGLPGGALAD